MTEKSDWDKTYEAVKEQVAVQHQGQITCRMMRPGIDSLSQKQIEKLEQIPGWSWDKNLDEVQKFIDENGSLPS